MARKKVALQWITNDATRRATFKKRRKGLMKKAGELATLCDVKACVVVYGDGEAQPEVWPSVAEAAPILARFKALPELDQCKKMMNQEGFLRQRVAKLQEQIHKAERENRERGTTALLLEALLGRLPCLVSLTVEELTSLGWMVEMRLNNVMECLQQRRAGQTSAIVPAALSSPTEQMSATYSASNNMDYMMRAPMYQALTPSQENTWLGTVTTPGGDLGAMVRSSFLGDNYNVAAGPSSSRDDMAMFSPGYSWADVAGPSFPPM